jgi:hypothetical protein
MKEQKLKSLNRVTTLQKTIHKPKEIDLCEVCATIKMRNRINVYVFKRKANLLNLILIDIYGPLPVTLNDARYFLKTVDNHTRKS